MLTSHVRSVEVKRSKIELKSNVREKRQPFWDGGSTYLLRLFVQLYVNVKIEPFYLTFRTLQNT